MDQRHQNPQGQVVGRDVSLADQLDLYRSSLGSRSREKKRIGSALTLTQSAARIGSVVAVKLVFKYQGLRSLPWGVRRSLLRRIPGFGSANLLGQTATAFFARRSRPSPSPSPHSGRSAVGPILVAQRLVRRAKA